MADILAIIGGYLFFILVVEILVLFAKYVKKEWQPTSGRGLLYLIAASGCVDYFLRGFSNETEFSQRFLYLFAAIVAYVIAVALAVYPHKYRWRAVLYCVTITLIWFELTTIGSLIKNSVQIDGALLYVILLGVYVAVIWLLLRIFKLEIRSEFREEKDKHDKKKAVTAA